MPAGRSRRGQPGQPHAAPAPRPAAPRCWPARARRAPGRPARPGAAGRRPARSGRPCCARAGTPAGPGAGRRPAARNRVDVRQPVGVAVQVCPPAGGPTVPAQVEPVHRPAVREQGVDDRPVAPGVLAEAVADQQHPGRRTCRQPALPEQPHATGAVELAVHVLRRHRVLAQCRPAIRGGPPPVPGWSRRPARVRRPSARCRSDRCPSIDVALDRCPAAVRHRRRGRSAPPAGCTRARPRTGRTRRGQVGEPVRTRGVAAGAVDDLAVLHQGDPGRDDRTVPAAHRPGQHRGTRHEQRGLARTVPDRDRGAPGLVVRCGATRSGRCRDAGRAARRSPARRRSRWRCPDRRLSSRLTPAPGTREPSRRATRNRICCAGPAGLGRRHCVQIG